MSCCSEADVSIFHVCGAYGRNYERKLLRLSVLIFIFIFILPTRTSGVSVHEFG